MVVREGYKQTEIGVIPEDWNVILFGQLITNICYGPRFSSRDYSKDGNVKTIRGTDINHKGDIKYEQVPKAKLPSALVNEHKLVDGDLVMITTAECGLTGVYIDDGFPFIASAYAVRISLDSSVSSFFFKHVFQTKFAKKQIDLYIRKGTVGNLPGSDILKFKFALPPTLAEQKAIATALSDADALISNLEKFIAKKKAIKQGAMQQLLTGKKRLPGFSGVSEVLSLGSLAKIYRGASPRPIADPIWFDNNSNVGWVRISDVTKSIKFLKKTVQRLSEAGIKQSRFIPKGSLIMSICATVGRPIITELNVCIHDGFVVFDNPNTNIIYLYYCLLFIEDDWSKNGQTGSQMNLNTTLINNKLIYVPLDLLEQKAIATTLTDMDAELEVLEGKKVKAQQIKQGMMQDLLTGKTRLV